jgi:hypothetical protein
MIKFNEIFFNTFTKDELIKMSKDAVAVSEDCIVIVTEVYFFQLDIDTTKNEVIIYSQEHKQDSLPKILTKGDFKILYELSPMMEIIHMEIDE